MMDNSDIKSKSDILTLNGVIYEYEEKILVEKNVAIKGNIILKQIEDVCEFWCLFDELKIDCSEIFDRETLLMAFKNGNMYGLEMDPDDEMYSIYKDPKYIDNPQDHPIFASGDDYGSDSLLPCFCIKEGDRAHIICVHTRARNQGLGSKLVKLLEIKQVRNPLPESRAFWVKNNINICT